MKIGLGSVPQISSRTWPLPQGSNRLTPDSTYCWTATAGRPRVTLYKSRPQLLVRAIMFARHVARAFYFTFTSFPFRGGHGRARH